MTRVLLTGFAPFDGESTNPSWQAVRAAADEPPTGIEAFAVELPCVYGASSAGRRA
ncbi:pyroglutamyl-peptidase I family protein, partial [Streptomyces decoyicus]